MEKLTEKDIKALIKVKEAGIKRWKGELKGVKWALQTLEKINTTDLEEGLRENIEKFKENIRKQITTINRIIKKETSTLEKLKLILQKVKAKQKTKKGDKNHRKRSKNV